MRNWKESVFSDGTANFVNRPAPDLGDEVRIRVQLLSDAPVRKVFLRTLRNGTQVLFEMRRTETVGELAVYQAALTVTQPVTKYRFIFAAEDGIYYYNQQGLTRYFPEGSRDFTLLADYRRPAFVENTVFYQIFPERFSTGDTDFEDDPDNDLFLGEYPFYRWYGGTLEGVRRRIPYLKALGVNAIYLNPIFTAPSTHKYDCADYFHVDADFGGDEALAALSAELHENGMKLMLDISVNHTGRKHEWFKSDELRDRFYLHDKENGGYLGWAGVPGLPVLDYTNAAVREIVYRAPDSVLRKWLQPPFSIDGWRFDVADVFGRHDEVQLADELWREVCGAIREEKPGTLIVAEDWGDCCAYEQGDAWDTAMNYYGCARPLREFYGVPDLFNMRDFTLRDMTKKLPAEAFAEQVMAHLSRIPGVFHANQFNLFDSHDIPRLHNMPGMGAELYRGAVLLLFLLPGMPSVYYGDEVLIGGGSVGDVSARWPMPWRELGALTGEKKEIFELYRTLIRLRLESPALKDGSFLFLCAKGRVISIARFSGGEILVGVVSASEKEEKIPLPLWRIGAEAPEDGPDLLGRTFVWETDADGGAVICLPPRAAALFRCPAAKRRSCD